MSEQFCSGCGAVLQPGNSFCTNCGKAFASPQPVPNAQQFQGQQPYGNQPQFQNQQQFQGQQPYGNQPQFTGAQPGGMAAGGQMSMIMNIVFIAQMFCALMVIIASFLPFASVSFFGYSTSINYIEGDGKITLIFGIIIAVLGVLGRKKPGTNIPAAILSFLTLIIPLIDSGSVKDEDYSALVTFGAGYYMLIIFSIILLGCSVTSIILANKMRPRVAPSYNYPNSFPNNNYPMN